MFKFAIILAALAVACYGLRNDEGLNPEVTTTEENLGTTTEENLGTTTEENLGTTTEENLGTTTEENLDTTTEGNLDTITEENLGTTTEENLGTTTEENLETTTEENLGTTTEENLDTTTEGNLDTITEENLDTNLYYVYTRQNKQIPISVLATKDSIDKSPILLTRRTVILVHGHGGSHTTSLNPVVRDALLTAEDLNIIVVDWSVFSSHSYSIAAGTVPLAAERLVALIRLLVEGERVNLNELHLVGFDLGAHIVGITGRTLNGAVARITGLDPSGRQWGFGTARLRINDARYVEVIHTDGSGLLANGIGTALGNVDFFANGGSNQPGCLSHSCSHDRAFYLFAASMINPSLVGYPCSSNLQLTLNLCRGLPLRMGSTLLSKAGAGIYRSNTRRNFPF